MRRSTRRTDATWTAEQRRGQDHLHAQRVDLRDRHDGLLVDHHFAGCHEPLDDDAGDGAANGASLEQRESLLELQ
jgi:hypothetical protein